MTMTYVRPSRKQPDGRSNGTKLKKMYKDNDCLHGSYLVNLGINPFLLHLSDRLVSFKFKDLSTYFALRKLLEALSALNAAVGNRSKIILCNKKNHITLKLRY